MPVTIRCPAPACRRPLRISDAALGHTIRCPHCAQVCQAPAQPAETLPLPPEAPAANAAPTETLPLPPEAVTSASTDPPRGTGLPERIGRFEVRAWLGAGGFGDVYRAYDPQLDREVALKLAKPEQLASPGRVKRFLREAKAAANLRHPHIVPVFDSGQDGGHSYIASAFIAGRSLAQELQAQPDGRGIEPRRAAELVRHLAEALAYANGRGVVHRDVKPANVMLDEHGAPLLLDFGLAARPDEAEKLTQEGVHALGTPAYLAPEQAAGEAQAASDQYSLGCTLYELLTGRTPFAGTPELQLFLHRTQEAPSPCKLRPGLARDVETICLKCLAKEPQRRYADCQALADDLRRFLDGELIQARRVGVVERAGRWCRKNPLAGTLAAAVVLCAALAAVCLVAGASAASYFAWEAGLKADEANTNAGLFEAEAKRTRKEKEHAEEETKRAERETKRAENALEDVQKQKKAADDNWLRAEWKVYAANLQLAQAAWGESDAARAKFHLNACRKDFRGWEYDFLDTLFNSRQMTLEGHTGQVTGVAFSGDGKRLASSSVDGTVKVWDATSGQELLNVKAHAGRVTGMAFSADGKRLASTGFDQTVKVWDATSGQELLTLKKDDRKLFHGMAFSADGKRLASANIDGTVMVWDAASGQELLTLKGHTRPVVSVAFSGDSKRLASAGSASFDRTVKVWDATSGQELLTLKGHTSVAFSGDGKRLASAGSDRTVKVWDATSGQELVTLWGHTGSVTSVAFSGDGKRLASASVDSTVKVWDAASGQELLTLKGHIGTVGSVAFSADGKRLASAGFDRTVKVWDATSSQEVLTLKGLIGMVLRVAFSADGKRLASASDGDGTVKVWDATSGQEVLTLKGDTRGASSVAFSADGKRLASGRVFDGTVKVWDATSGQELLTLKGHIGTVGSVAFSADGKRLASAGVDRTVKVWDATSGQEVFTLKGHIGAVTSVAFSADGKRLASAGFDRTVKVWDATSGQEVFTLKGHIGAVTSVAFSADGKRLASASYDATVRVWDATSGQELLTLKGHSGMVRSVAFSPDGKRLASASEDRTVKVWDAESGQEVLTLMGHSAAVRGVAFSGDGDRLASASDDGTVKVWEASSGQKPLNLPRQPAPRTTPIPQKPPMPDPHRIIGQPPLAAPTPVPAGSWEKLTQVEDRLTDLDAADKVRMGSRHKVHALKLAAGRTYRIDMVSTQIDPYLRLENAAGQQLAADDDSGGNLNARIIFTAPLDGEYRIIATSFAAARGAYTLTVYERKPRSK